MIVAIPEVEPVVATWRAELDPSARWGVPAHVTVLYPFLAPQHIDADVIARLRAAVRRIHQFVVTLRHVTWFDDDVVWAEPEPAAPFRALTGAVWRTFPETPPYGGAFSEPIPHLTIGDGAPLHRMRAAADDVQPQLPISAEIASGDADLRRAHCRLLAAGR